MAVFRSTVAGRWSISRGLDIAKVSGSREPGYLSSLFLDVKSQEPFPPVTKNWRPEN